MSANAIYLARTRPRVFAPILAMVLGSLCMTAFAQKKPASKPPKSDAAKIAEFTPDAVRARLKIVQESGGFDEATRGTLTDLYNRAIEQFRLADEWKAKTAAFEKDEQEAPARIENLKKELEKPIENQKPAAPKDASLVQLEQLRAQVEIQLGAAQQKLTELQNELQRRADRRIEIPNLVGAAKDSLADAVKELAAAPVAGENAELSLAKRAWNQARKKAAENEIAACEKELVTFDARAELLPYQRDQSQREVSRLEKLLAAWSDLLNESRRQEAERAAQMAQEAKKAAMNAHPAVRKRAEELAEENAKLADLRGGEHGLAAKIKQSAGELADVNAQLDKITNDFKNAQTKLDVAGASNAVGQLLRKHRSELPSLREHLRRRKARQEILSEVQIKLLDLEEERSALADIEGQVKGIMSGVAKSVSQDDRQDIENTIRELLQTKRGYLIDVKGDYDSYFGKLVDLDAAEEKLIDAIRGYSDFINEHILWIRSTGIFGRGDAERLGEAVAWLLNPDQWRLVGVAAAYDLQYNALLNILGALLIGTLIVTRGRSRSHIQHVGELIYKNKSNKVTDTLDVVALTFLLALAGPLVCWHVAWRIGSPWDASEFAKSLASGLRETAYFLLLTEFFRQSCRPKGLADAHFGWSPQTISVIRKNLAWFMAVGAPAFFLKAMTEVSVDDTRKESLGRLAFMAAHLTLSVFLFRVLRPYALAILAARTNAPGGRLRRFRGLWVPAAIVIPATLAAISYMGFYYTGVQLTTRLKFSITFGLILLVLHEIALRWAFIAKKNLSIKQYRQKREAAMADGKDAAAVSVGGEATPLVLQAFDVDLSVVSAQLRRLLRASVAFALVIGLWFIWVDVLPALGVLRHVELWTHTVRVAQTVSPGGAQGALKMVEEPVAITLADLLLALAILVMTFIAGSNLPGLLEISILQRLEVESGLRYAIATISRYLITVIGIVIAFETIGIGWSNVQWMAAAITVGLGFGLQEIFGNFISGLILLLERPLRVGDTVTIGGMTGVVSRIRFRATTVVDADRKEVIIPNREFITGRLVNWTLSDPMQRLVIPLGIGYGADLALLEKTLLAVAKAHPLVLSNPEPLLFFESFGESAINVSLRVHLASIEHLGRVRHQLHIEIERALRAAGIEIAFPQLDVRLRPPATGSPSRPS